MNNNKLLYYSEATIQKYQNLIFALLCIAAFVYCIFHFSENPVVISIILIVLLYILITTGYGQLFIYHDAMIYQVKHPISLFTKTWKFELDNIDSIDVHLQLTKKSFFMSELAQSFIPGGFLFNTLNIKMKSGKEKKIFTKILKKNILSALDIIQKSSAEKISITGLDGSVIN